MDKKKTQNLFDEYYSQDVEEGKDTTMAGYGVYGQTSAGGGDCSCCDCCYCGCGGWCV